MNNDEKIQELISTFVEYRNLFTPIEQNLQAFANTYEDMKSSIDNLNNTFDGNIQDQLNSIYKNISSQLERSRGLALQLDNFKQKTDKFASELDRLTTTLSAIENRISAIDEIENKANQQIEKLDNIVEQKRKMYNIKDLERNLESYTANVQKINDYINKDIAGTIIDNNEKINAIKNKSDSVLEVLTEEKSNIVNLIENYKSSNNILKKIVEANDVNEQYIYDILDKWAKDRGVKTKK